MTDKTLTKEDCLDAHRGDCRGKVEYHSTDPGFRPAFPRCSRHWDRHLDEQDRLRSAYPDSPIAPDWFDPSYAGECWDYD